MKYGLMYYKTTDNIGDDIQTYVAMKYLPHVDYYIDREALSCFVPEKKEYVSMIMNGWYIHNKLAWPPSPYINPLLISMHFKESKETDIGDMYLKNSGGEFLKKYGPVGARDIETQQRLKNNGIESYFSGCMTLTLEKFNDIEKENKICLVDVSQEVIEKVKKNTDSEIEVLSHFLNQKETENKTIEQRMNEVENLLKKYQESKLVITNRLHVALPCVALETPVILLHKEFYDEDRLGTFLELFTNFVDENFLKMDIKELLQHPKVNNNKYIKIKNEIDNKCKEFIKKCEQSEELFLKKTNELPNIEDYKKYVQKLNWHKEIYEKERLVLEEIEQKRVREFKLYHKQLEILNKKYQEDLNKINIEKQELITNQDELKKELENYKFQNQNLNKELSDIYNSRGWKYLDKIRKIL